MAMPLDLVAEVRVIADAIRQLKPPHHSSLLDVSRELGNGGGFLVCRGHQPVPLAKINPRTASGPSTSDTTTKNFAVVLGSLVAARRHGRLLAVVPPERRCATSVKSMMRCMLFIMSFTSLCL